MYYKYAPEFTIKCEYDKSRKGYEVYMLGQIDNTPYWYDIQLYYHSTLLHTVSAVALDGARCFSTAPNRKFIKIDKKNYCYYYFDYHYFLLSFQILHLPYLIFLEFLVNLVNF